MNNSRQPCTLGTFLAGRLVEIGVSHVFGVPGGGITSARSPGCWFSVNRAYRLCMQADANLVLYNNARNQAIWASDTVNRSTRSPYGAWMNSNGRLTLFDAAQVNYWLTPTTSSTGPFRLQVQNDGDVVIYNGVNRAIWATNTVNR